MISSIPSDALRRIFQIAHPLNAARNERSTTPVHQILRVQSRRLASRTIVRNGTPKAPLLSSTKASPPKFPQEAFDKLFIIKSKDPPPESFSAWLDSLRSNDGSISEELEHELILEIADSKNRRLMQKATEQLEWTDQESIRLLIVSWTKILREPRRGAKLLLDWQRQTQRFDQMPKMGTYRLVLSGLAQEPRNSELASEVLEELYKQSPRLLPDRDCFHRVLGACSNDPARAEETLMKMIHLAQSKRLDVMPNLSTYRLLFTSWSNSRQKGAGKRAMELLRSCPVNPDTLCYNMVMNALANDGDYERAEDVLMEALREKKADRVSIYTIFKAHEKAGTKEAVIAAQDFLDRIGESKDSSHGLKLPRKFNVPNARTYATVIGMWAKLGQPKRAWDLLQKLEDKAEQPDGRRYRADQITYQAVIGSLSKGSDKQTRQNAEKAQELLESMALRFRLNPVTCNTVIKCWTRAKNPDAAKEKVLDRMVDWRVSPDIVSYNTIIQSYARMGMAVEAEGLFNELLSSASSATSEVIPNSRTFTAIMMALSTQKSVPSAEKAEELLAVMIQKHKEEQWNTSPDIYTYNTVLRCWCTLRDGTRAESFFRKMEQEVKPDVISYNSLLNAYYHNFEKGVALVEEMMERKIKPDRVTQRTLLQILTKDKRVRNKDQVSKETMERFFL
ncbi:unnamed protein product [Cylindrotheca closterium]|uniref:Pentacotripeptide-repeat region of PRORP domain-containing protein n=1 Tax=Cylindrotheca closterium TaxID=2856 RepID=A0AAD2GAR6_9STRA|nr:unnamed protein product [Cylindrotheca closterium]